MNGPPVKLVRSDECAVCQAARNIGDAAGAVFLKRETPEEIARTHFIVALIVGFRRDLLDVCLSCKGIIDRSAAMIEQRSNGRVIL